MNNKVINIQEKLNFYNNIHKKNNKLLMISVKVSFKNKDSKLF